MIGISMENIRNFGAVTRSKNSFFIASNEKTKHKKEETTTFHTPNKLQSLTQYKFNYKAQAKREKNFLIKQIIYEQV